MSINEFYNKIFKSFNKYNVKYLLIGAYAVASHGYYRATEDLDIWIENSDENYSKIKEALLYFGYSKEGCKKAFDELKKRKGIYILDDANNRIDIVQVLPPKLKFENHIKKEKFMKYMV